MDPNYLLMRVIFLVIRVLTLIIFVDAILTWFPNVNRYHPVVVALRKITTPIYRPIRQLIPPEKTGYIDISPMIAILGLYVIGMVMQSILLR